MSAAYNLRVGLMMAALSFGTSESVRQVSLHIDSIGLEEAIAEQDSAIEAMMSEALSAFEHLRSGDLGRVGSKADPKDGDFHGDPTRPITHEETFGQMRPVTNTARPGEPATVPDRLRMLRIRPRPNPLTPMAPRPSIRSSKT